MRLIKILGLGSIVVMIVAIISTAIAIFAQKYFTVFVSTAVFGLASYIAGSMWLQAIELKEKE